MALQLLSHPLTLLLVGAVFTGFLAPRLSESWQDAGQAFQLKVALVEEISRTTELYFSRLQLLELQGIRATVSLDEALCDWRVSYAILEAKLGTYFPSDPTIGLAWQELGAALWTTYFLLKNDTPSARRTIYKQNVGIFPDDVRPFRTLIKVPITNVGDSVAQYDLALQRLLDGFRYKRLDVLNDLMEGHLRLRPTSTSGARALTKRLRRTLRLPHPRDDATAIGPKS